MRITHLPLCPWGAVVMDQPATMAEQVPLAGIGGETFGGAGWPLLQIPERWPAVIATPPL